MSHETQAGEKKDKTNKAFPQFVGGEINQKPIRLYESQGDNMSIQSGLNNAALEQLPKILNLIANADRFERDQIINYTLRHLMQCSTCLDDMTQEQKSEFENNLIAIFKEKNWS